MLKDWIKASIFFCVVMLFVFSAMALLHSCSNAETCNEANTSDADDKRSKSTEKVSSEVTRAPHLKLTGAVDPNPKPKSRLNGPKGPKNG